jgi:predicted GNAT family N-acyltransferase
VIQIARTDDLETCYALRHTVFVLEQGYTAEGEVDVLDAQSHHLLAREDGTPVGTARVYLDQDTAKIGRVCVLVALRGTGLGADLVKAAVTMSAQMGARRAVLGAQVHAIGFYEKLGFAACGAPYDDEGEPHQMMTRTL